jgi:transcriptional regulator of acetoin/glycerol metabolism
MTGSSAVEQGKTLKDVEREVIVRAFHASGRNVTIVAKGLGVTRATIYRKLRQYGELPQRRVSS